MRKNRDETVNGFRWTGSISRTHKLITTYEFCFSSLFRLLSRGQNKNCMPPRLDTCTVLAVMNRLSHRLRQVIIILNIYSDVMCTANLFLCLGIVITTWALSGVATSECNSPTRISIWTRAICFSFSFSFRHLIESSLEHRVNDRQTAHTSANVCQFRSECNSNEKRILVRPSDNACLHSQSIGCVCVNHMYRLGQCRVVATMKERRKNKNESVLRGRCLPLVKWTNLICSIRSISSCILHFAAWKHDQEVKKSLVIYLIQTIIWLWLVIRIVASRLVLAATANEAIPFHIYLCIFRSWMTMCWMQFWRCGYRLQNRTAINTFCSNYVIDFFHRHAHSIKWQRINFVCVFNFAVINSIPSRHGWHTQ